MGAFSHAQFAQFRRLTGQLSSVSGDVSSVAGDVAAVASDVNSLTGEVTDVKTQAAATQQDLIDLLASISNLVVPVGAYAYFAKDIAPTGWLFCDGSEVSRATYANLYAYLGDSFGAGDGSTTFNLPDSRTRVLAGLDTTISDFETVGKKGGATSHVLTAAEIPAHTHTQVAHRHFTSNNGNGSNTEGVAVTNAAPHGTQSYWNFSNPGNSSSVAPVINSNTGGGGAHTNLQPYLVAYCCIKT